MQLAYILTDRPGERNATLRALAEALKASGLHAVGAVQLECDPDATCQMDLLLLPDGPQVCISQALGPGSTGCRLDPDRLEHVVQAADTRLADGADVVIVNKFGHHEAEGHGFRQLIAAAAEREVPVVVGLAGAQLADFLAFAGDLATRLPCDPAALAEWCRTEARIGG
ncbi:DUF2478 domain-containing protein [Tropicimonas sp. IMCC34043]|uniref:DUF2478 domain-containing protein n=1 Tax=Tropicimonas sp. IMCC34043 TaxID=2248760 RepID=UPI001300742F|nr:DUF2478 domain-containing protein [Tropicimonas sp. IMCC34043]